MPVSPASTSFAPDLPFKYVGGDPSLDLVNTVDWRSSGLANDRLVDYATLTRWTEGAGIVPKRVAKALRDAAEARPREAEMAYEAARSTRWVLQRLFSSVAAGRIDEPVLADFNDHLADSLRRLRVDMTSGGTGSGPDSRSRANVPGSRRRTPIYRGYACCRILNTA